MIENSQMSKLQKLIDGIGKPSVVDNDTLYLVLDKDDPVRTAFNYEPQLLVEYNQYKAFLPTKCVYRFDKANNAYEKDHIHVYSDSKHNHQLYAICFDGTTHDGSKYVLPKKHQEALRQLGFTVPKDGLLEWISIAESNRMLLLD